MWWVVASILWLVRNLILEFIFFILVDVVAKTPLRDAANDAEKRTIWLCESVVLLAVCGLIYWADHTPYLLLALAGATGIYTQLCGRIDIHQWWITLCTRWEEYQQHEESMRQVQAHLARQQAMPQVSPGLGPGASPGLFPGLPTAANMGISYMMPSQVYPPNVTLLTRQEIPGAPSNTTGPVFRGSHGGLIWSGMSQSNNASGGYFTQPSMASPVASFGRGPNPPPFVTQAPVAQSVSPPGDRNPKVGDNPSSRFGGDLRRKPLRQFESRMFSPSLGLATSGATSIKNRFMNALGFGDSAKKPPGLRNKGQNQCFMNSVLQCLARSPYLAQFLAVDSAKELEGTVSESLFLSTLSELLDLLTAEPETLDTNVLDPSHFRQASSSLNKSLVSQLGQPQSQQDAAEFLMWMLDMVHCVLNRNRQALSCGADAVNGDERFTSPRLAMLRFIYGDLTPARARELKDVCMREIELANGLENDSYAESIQRLSDLEWLLHKQSNESIVDDLFTGQLVEALLCTSNNRISVTLQTFNVLPVPLASPRPVSGLVLLEDCFTAFCHIEHLVNSKTLTGAATAWNANAARQRAGDGAATGSPHITPQVAGPRTRSSTRLVKQSVDSGVPPTPLGRIQSVVSPIAGKPESQYVDDSGFCDNNAFKTSTPIPRDSAGSGMMVDSAGGGGDVQRRCLLRQLPECLIIQLMRFQYNVQQGRSTKLRAPVSVRLKGLDLQALVYDTVTQREDLAAPAGGSGPEVYDLYGLCLHLGADSTHHGHYVSYSLASDGRWYRFDDESVTQVNMEYELTTKEVRQNVYILFYKRAAE